MKKTLFIITAFLFITSTVFPQSKININDLVEKIIGKQIDSGQFVNADITLKEITQIKKLYKKKLVNIHHARVEY